MAILITEKGSAEALCKAMAFSVQMENNPEIREGDRYETRPRHCEQLMHYLSRTLLGWGGNGHSLWMGGVEEDHTARRFYADWCIRDEEGNRVINGGLMFRDDEWTVHT